MSSGRYGASAKSVPIPSAALSAWSVVQIPPSPVVLVGDALSPRPFFDARTFNFFPLPQSNCKSWKV